MQTIKRKKKSGIALSRDKMLFIIIGILAIVLILLIVLAVKGRGSKAGKTGNEYYVGDENAAGNGKNVFEVNSYPEVSSLVNEYFVACAANDFTVLDQIVSDMSEEESNLIKRRSEYVEEYRDIVSNTKLGPIENSYLVFATFNMKFNNVETPVPGMETLYVRTDDSGKMYIYKGTIESEVQNYINDAVNSEDAKAIINKVKDDYLNVLAENNDALAFVEKFEVDSDLINQAKELAKTKESDEAKAKAEEEARRKQEEENKKKEEEAAAAANAAQNAQQTNDKVTIIQTVNVRGSNSETAEKVAHLFVGDIVNRLSVTDDGWSQIQYEDGKTGYVKTEYVSTYTSTEDKVKPTTIVNIRSECSETADIIGQLDSDLSYTRNVIYDNGWSQIALEGSVGYVKTEYLEKK